jgi:hypothetical protein
MISRTSTSPMASGSMTMSGMAASVLALRERRGAERRAVVVARLAGLAARRRVALAALRVDLAGGAGFLVAGFLVAAFLVAVLLVVVAPRRRVVAGRAPVPLAIRRACFVRLSMRLSTLFTSARVLARLT